jgi:large subunit ribosomal protein L4
MPKVSLYKKDGTEAGQIELNDAVFGAEVNEAAMHQVVVAQLAAKRQGTQSVLTRAEVRGGGIKPWRQKGTGRARAGSSRSPVWTKGGVVFAMKPRDYTQKVNKKLRQLAIRSALSMKVNDGDIIVLEDLTLDAPKTKLMAGVLRQFDAKKALVVTYGDGSDSVVRASGNIPNVKTLAADCVNVYDLLNYDKLVITQDAVKKVEEVFA